MAIKQVVCCDFCGKLETEVGTILPLFFLQDANDGKDCCWHCADTELRKMYGRSGESGSTLIPIEEIKPKGDGLTDRERARAKRREQLTNEHGTPVYVVKPAVEAQAGQIIDHKAGDVTKKIEIIEGVHEQEGLFFAKIVI